MTPRMKQIEQDELTKLMERDRQIEMLMDARDIQREIERERGEESADGE